MEVDFGKVHEFILGTATEQGIAATMNGVRVEIDEIDLELVKQRERVPDDLGAFGNCCAGGKIDRGRVGIEIARREEASEFAGQITGKGVVVLVKPLDEGVDGLGGQFLPDRFCSHLSQD